MDQVKSCGTETVLRRARGQLVVAWILRVDFGLPFDAVAGSLDLARIADASADSDDDEAQVRLATATGRRAESIERLEAPCWSPDPQAEAP